MEERNLCVQLRANSTVVYWESGIKSHGNKESLRQNVRSDFDNDLKRLLDTKDEIDLDNWYKQYTDLYQCRKEQLEKEKGIEARKIGVTARASKKTVKRVIENFVSVVYECYNRALGKDNAYIVFVTLTLPSKQIHTDKLMKRQLALYIEKLQRNYGVQNYVWRAECQKNGNIHFHLLIDKFVDKTIIRDEWNEVINRLGYVDRSGIENPYSTDVHSMGKTPDDVIRYVTKYLTKVPDEAEYSRSVVGRVWGCKRELTKFKYFTVRDSLATKVDRHLVTNCESQKIALPVDFVSIYGVGLNYFKNVFADIYEKYRRALRWAYFCLYGDQNEMLLNY